MRRLLLAAMLLAATAFAQNDAVTVIRAGTLIDGRSAQPLHNAVIVIHGNRIESVGGAAPAGAKVIDLANTVVLPGLIDTHTHIFLQGEVPAEGGYDVQLLKYGLAFRAARATVSARRCLEQGFTTIRDVETEGADAGDVGIKQAIEKGYIPGPRIFTTTRSISTTNGYPLEGYAPEIEFKIPKGSQLINGPGEARKAVREQLELGADWIKVYMTHRSWVTPEGKLGVQPTLTLEEIKAITDEAHSQGHKVACHAYGGLGLHRALDGGCDSIEHGLDLDDASIAQMAKQGTWYVPTFTVYHYDQAPKGTPEAKRDELRVSLHGPSFQRALKAGVKIAFGTDVGGFPWSDPIAQEFGYLVKFGMTPMQAIQSATSRAAEMLDMQGQLGIIAPGAHADIIAVQGDPLQDVNVLKDVRFVMKDGKVFKNEVSVGR